MTNQLAGMQSQETLSQTICRLAKAKDKAALTEVIQSGVSINIFQEKCSPIMVLVKESDYGAVEFLINNFNADRNVAIRCAATEGHVELVKKLIVDEASKNWAVWGAGEGNHVELVKQLIAEGADLNLAVEGAAAGNHIDLVRQLIKDGASPDYAVRGAAVGNRIDLVAELIKDKEHKPSLHYAIWGAALGNHIELVFTLIEAGADLNQAVWGAAAGNHIELVNMLITAGANVNEAVCGAAAGNRIDLVNKLIKDHKASPHNAVRGAALGDRRELLTILITDETSRNHAVWGAMAGDHPALVNKLITEGASRQEAVKGAEESGHLNDKQEVILRFISYFDDAELRKLLIKKAKEKNTTLDAKLLLAQSAKSNQLMREYQINFNQAQVWQSPGLHTWFLQGMRKFNDELPAEIMLHISAYITGLSDRDTINLFEKHNATVPKKLFDASINKISKEFNASKSFSLFNLFGLSKPRMSQEKYLEKQKEAVERCQNRMNF